MASLTGKVARIAVTAAAPTSSTDNAAVLSTDGVTLPITSTGKRHWPNNTTSLVVAVGGTATTDAYTVNYVEGVVTFSTPHSTASTYTIDVETLTASFVGEGRDWSLRTDVDMRDHTAFSTGSTDTQWRTVKPGLAGGTVTINRFWGETTGPAFFDRLAANQDTIVELWTDHATRNKLEAFAWVSEDGFDVPLDGDAAEAITLTVNDQIYMSTA